MCNCIERNYREIAKTFSISYHKIISVSTFLLLVGLGGIEVTCSPRDPRFAHSNPAEVDGFFSGCKNPEYKSSRRDFKLGVPES